MQGLFIRDGKGGIARPKSKKQVKEVLADNPLRIIVEATSWFGNEYDGPAAGMPRGDIIGFVGPDPHAKRNFYGQLIRRQDGTFLVK